MARKQNNIHYIYKITCNITGRWYIGMHSTSNLADGYMGSGTILRHSIRKYSKENHTKDILEFYQNREELVKREREIINKELISDGKCMNLKEGGDGGFSNEEHMMKCSKAGNNAFKEKLKRNEEFFDKISKTSSEKLKQTHKDGKLKYGISFKDKNHTEETKQLMSDKKKGLGVGENNSQYGTCWITRDGLNKKIKKEDLGVHLIEGWIKGRK